MWQDVGGWTLLVVIVLLPLVSPAFQRDRRLALVLWTGVLCHHAVALQLSYLAGLSSDASDMHRLAVASAASWKFSFVLGDPLYVQWLATAYSILGASSFLGQQLSIAAYAFSCLAFVKVLDDMEVRKDRWVLLALFALPLSMLRYTSTTIREAYQILFFVLAVRWAIRFKLRHELPAFVLMAMSAFLMGAFHHGLLVYAVAFVGLVYLWPMPSAGGASQERVQRGLITAATVAVVLVAGYGAVSRVGGGAALSAVLSSRALEYAARFRAAALAIDARTTYQVALDASSPGALLLSIVPVFFYYMFAPFPWQVRTPDDLYGLMEAVLRALLLGASIHTWWNARGMRRSLTGMLLGAYFGLALLWALGTVNYGTAIRHHLTTTWILIATGGPALVRWLGRAARSFLWGPRPVRLRA